MTAVVLVIVGLGFAPVTFTSIAACEQAFRDVMQVIDQGQPVKHSCLVVRVR